MTPAARARKARDRLVSEIGDPRRTILSVSTADDDEMLAAILDTLDAVVDLLDACQSRKPENGIPPTGENP